MRTSPTASASACWARSTQGSSARAPMRAPSFVELTRGGRALGRAGPGACRHDRMALRPGHAAHDRRSRVARWSATRRWPRWQQRACRHPIGSSRRIGPSEAARRRRTSSRPSERWWRPTPPRRQTSTRERSFLERVGLIGGPDSAQRLTMANGRFADGDLRGAAEAISEAQTILASADTARPDQDPERDPGGRHPRRPGGAPHPPTLGVHCCAMTVRRGAPRFPTAARRPLRRDRRRVLRPRSHRPGRRAARPGRDDGDLLARHRGAVRRRGGARLPARDLQRGERRSGPDRRVAPRRRSVRLEGGRACASRRATRPSACTRPPSWASWPPARAGRPRRGASSTRRTRSRSSASARATSIRAWPTRWTTRRSSAAASVPRRRPAPGWRASPRPARCRTPWSSSSATRCAPPRPSTAISTRTCRASSWSTRSRTRRRSPSAWPRRSAIGCGASGWTRPRSAGASRPSWCARCALGSTSRATRT